MKRSSRIFSVGLFIVLLALPLVAIFQRQNIYDWYRLQGYTPPAAIVALADNTTMNDYGRKLFYVNHPELDGIDSFRQHCSDSEKSIVLGCYISNDGIYLYSVSDQRLKGVTEVTSAHETLHAAYDRLSSSERQKVDEMTQQAFAKLNNGRIRETIEQYRSKDPSVVPSELHSVLGTEVASLTPELEAYYKRYFNNRAKIVSYSEQYEKEFNNRSSQINIYDQKLAELKQKIEAGEASLQAQIASLNADKNRLKVLLESDSSEEYNAAVPAYNAKVSAYNALLRSVQSYITQYNQTVAARNDLAKEIKDLVDAIDTRLPGEQSQQ